MLQVCTSLDLRQQFEQQRGSLLSSKKQKRTFLSVRSLYHMTSDLLIMTHFFFRCCKIVEKTMDDVIQSRSNTSPMTPECGHGSPLPCPICGERYGSSHAPNNCDSGSALFAGFLSTFYVNMPRFVLHPQQTTNHTFCSSLAEHVL